MLRRRILHNACPPAFQALKAQLNAAPGVNRTSMHDALIRLQNDA